MIVGREVVDFIEDKKNNNIKLFSKLANVKQYEFSEVNNKKTTVKPKKIVSSNNTIVNDSLDIDMFDCTTPFFDYRVAKAFPGDRGLKIYDNPEECNKRLAVLLRYPLEGKHLGDPVWYFRGSSCFYIKKYQQLSPTKCLLDINELELERIAIYKSDLYFRDFVYVETKADNPIGIYKEQNADTIELLRKELGYYTEEYGIYENHPITRAEYDDGAAVIDGNLIDFGDKAQLRVRYLTKYNFVICAKFHPFNSPEGDTLTRKYLDNILNGNCTIEEFAEASKKLKRNRNDD